MSERFQRERVRYESQRRSLQVLRTEMVAPTIVRITLGGDELSGFESRGPADHVKVLFPNPKKPQDSKMRDYTPRAMRLDAPDGPEIDIDFVLHGDSGPASVWAAQAKVGDSITIAGPRGSALAPSDVDSAVLIADETALPSISRWLEDLGEVPITGIFVVEDAETSRYLSAFEGPHRSFRWITGLDRAEQAEAMLRELTFDDGTLVFMAGESHMLKPLRRYLRRELELPKHQVIAQGYWKRGTDDFDHHSPIDPEDPDN